MFWFGNAYHHKLQAAANAAVGHRPVGTSILAGLGHGRLADSVRTQLDALGDGEAACVWAGPEFAQLDAGTVDFDRLPDDPSVTELAEVLYDYGQPVLVRICFECANRRPDKTLRYRDGATFSKLFDAIAARMPPNAYPVWSYGPNGWPIKFAEWIPTRARAADVSLFGRTPLLLNNPTGKNVATFVQVAEARGLPLMVGESGFMAKDYASPDGEAMASDAKRLLGWCVDNKVRLLAGPFNSDSYGMVPWAECAPVVSVLRRALDKGVLASLPLATENPHPLAWLAAGGEGTG